MKSVGSPYNQSFEEGLVRLRRDFCREGRSAKC